MKRRNTPSFPVRVMILSLLVPVSGALAGAVTGTWEFKYDFNERSVTAHVTFTEGDDGALSAVWNPQWPENTDQLDFDPSEMTFKVADVRLEENTLTFARTVTSPDFTFESDFKGTVDGDNLSGKISSDWGDIDVKAVRMGSAPAAVGTWNIRFEVPDTGEIKAVLDITQDGEGTLSAKMTEDSVENKISNVKYADGNLTFDRTMRFGDQDFEMAMAFAGKIEADKLSGVWESDVMDEISVTGARGD